MPKIKAAMRVPGFAFAQQPTMTDEDLLRHLTRDLDPFLRSRVEDIFDRANEDDIQKSIDDAVEYAEDRLRPYEEAWEEVYEVWEDVYADGVWPGHEPWDQSLRQAMEQDFRKGHRAIELINSLPEEIKATLLNQLIDGE